MFDPEIEAKKALYAQIDEELQKHADMIFNADRPETLKYYLKEFIQKVIEEESI